MARNTGHENPTSLENNIEESNILGELQNTLKMSRINARDYTEQQIIQSIKLFLTV